MPTNGDFIAGCTSVSMIPDGKFHYVGVRRQDTIKNAQLGGLVFTSKWNTISDINYQG